MNSDPKKALDRKIIEVIDEFWLGKLQEVAENEPVNYRVLRSVLPRHPMFIEVATRYRRREISLIDAGRLLEPYYPTFLADYAAAMAAQRKADFPGTDEDKPA